MCHARLFRKCNSNCITTRLQDYLTLFVILFTVWFIANGDKDMTTTRIFSCLAVLLIVAVFFTAVAHACSDLSAMRMVLQTPCDHHVSPDGSRDKPKDNCDSIRYGMLSTQAGPGPTDLEKPQRVLVDVPFITRVSLPDVVAPSRRSQAPPLAGLRISPLLSRIVLRI